MSNICRSCGAKIEYSAGSQSLACEYCGAVNEIKRSENALPTNIEKIIPLGVTKEDLQNRVYGYMASGDYTPDDMLESSAFSLREFFYIPAFSFQIEYEATWTASFGYDRKEPYTAYRSVTSNGHTHQEAYTAYRTVTDWRPQNGVDAGVLTVSTYAGKRLDGVDLSPASLVDQIVDEGSSTEFNPAYVEGVDLEEFSVPEGKAFESQKGTINSMIDNRVQSHGQGDHQKDWHWNATTRHSTTTLAVPLGHAVFEYEGTDYHFWIDGIGMSGVRADKLPEDKDKKSLVYSGYYPVAVGAAGLILSVSMWGFTWGSLVTTAIAGGYAALRRKAIVSYSKQIRQSLLTQIQASSSVISNQNEDEKQSIAKAFQRPEKPFFAKTHNDKISLTALSLVALIGAVVPNYLMSPDYLNSQQVVTNEEPEVQQRAEQQVEAPQVAAQQTEVQQATAQQAEEEPPVGQQPENQAEPEQEPAAAQEPAAHTQQQPPVAGSSVLDRAQACVDFKACFSTILASVSPRNEDAIRIAAVRINDLNKAVRGDRKTARDLNKRALDEFRGKNYNAAIDLFTQAVKADPADVEIGSNLGFALIQANRVDEADRPLADALVLESRRTSTWIPIAELFTVKGNREMAVRSLLLAYEFSGNKDKSIEYFEDQSQNAERVTMRPLYDSVLEAIKAGQMN